MNYLYFFIFSFNVFIEIYSSELFHITIELISVDDCLREIYLDDSSTNTTYFKNDNGYSYSCVYKLSDYTVPLFKDKPYELGQTIVMIGYDSGGNHGGISVTVYMNEYIIKTEHQKFWTCIDCETEDSNYVYVDEEKSFNFFDGKAGTHDHSDKSAYTFHFKVNSVSELYFQGYEVNSNYYSFTTQKYFYVTAPNLNEKIEILNLADTNIFYVENDKTFLPHYNEIGFQIIFDEVIPSSGKYYGINANENDIELNNEDLFRISQSKKLRYKLSNSEINNNGVYLKFTLQAFTNPFNKASAKAVSLKKEINIFICLNGYKFCDLETSMKCIKEG